MLNQTLISSIPEAIDLSNPGGRFQEIKLDCQPVFDKVAEITDSVALLAAAYARGDSTLLEEIWPWRKVFPGGKSWDARHVGDMEELERVINGGEITVQGKPHLRVGILTAAKKNYTALLTGLTQVDIPEVEIKALITMILDIEGVLWDRLNQAAYRAQNLHSTDGVYQALDWS